jgi:hypothetical protein
MEQAVQIVGAVLVLLGYVLGQTGRVDAKSRAYLLINLVGSALLAIVAAVGGQWGFLLLNGSWAVISIVSLLRPQFQADELPDLKGPGA